MLSTFYEKISFALKNMVRADLFSGSLVVWNVRGGAAHFCPARPEPAAGGRGRQAVAAASPHSFQTAKEPEKYRLEPYF